MGFVNGLPLVVIELKKPGVPARAAFGENVELLSTPQNGIPAHSCSTCCFVASNGTNSRGRSLTADWAFSEWKRIEREGEPHRVSLEVIICGTCDRTFGGLRAYLWGHFESESNPTSGCAQSAAQSFRSFKRCKIGIR